MLTVNPDMHFAEELASYQHDCEAEEVLQDAREKCAADLYAEALRNSALFRTLDDDYEIIELDQVQRALRNLDAAIKGDEHARDAVFIALAAMQVNIHKACDHQAWRDMK